MNVLDALRKTTKGRLKYDPYWYKEGALEEVLKECAALPVISTKSPTATAADPKRHLPVTGLSFTEAEIEDFNSSNEYEDKEKEKETTIGYSSKSLGSPCLESEKIKKNDLNRSHQGEQLMVPQVTPVDIALKVSEKAVKEEVQKSIHERHQLFERATANFSHDAHSALRDLYRRKDREAQRDLVAALEEQRARQAEAERFEQQCKERNKQLARLLDSKMREAQARRKQLLEEEDARRRQEAIEQLEAMAAIQTELKTMCSESVRRISACTHPQLLPENARRAPHVLAQLAQRLDALGAPADGAPSPQQLQEARDLTRKARACHDIIEKGVAEANAKGKAQNEAKAKEAAAAAAAAAAKAKAEAEKAEAAAKIAAAKADEILCVTEESFARYQQLQDKLRTVTNLYSQITANASLKKYKFDVQKAVNTPVNAISPTSGSHLRDKLQRILRLLQGGQVDVGGRRICAADHQGGVAFAMDLFAKKIVKQGEEQVSANHESAFALAAVTVGVWSQLPDVGDLLLAHFYARCPYTVPYYLPKKEGQTTEDYYRSLGYLYVDGSVEAQDKFLRRMSGIVRLFAALLTTPPPPPPSSRGSWGSTPPGTPLGMEHMWRWLTEVVTLEPRPDITATVLFDALQVAGAALHTAYRDQFVKLVRHVCAEVVPRLRKVTPAGAGGPVTRLESFLQRCVTSGSFPRPSGELLASFWYT